VTPRVGLVRSQLVNANTIHFQGIDCGGTARFDLCDAVRYTISGEASLLLDLSTTFPGGRKEKYVGTLGNYNLTAGSGTPRWRANVTQTVAVQDAYRLSGTVSYVAGYSLSGEDQGGVRTHPRHARRSARFGVNASRYSMSVAGRQPVSWSQRSTPPPSSHYNSGRCG
jgi:iron complex outermembrane receptor protein